METPKITVVTVCYNAVNEIRRTIESVVSQTYGNMEYIIIDGGSTDGTVDIIKQYQGKLAYWCSEPDKGIYDAMNKAVTHASGGGFCAFMNAGDTYAGCTVIEEIFKEKRTADFIVGIAKIKGGYWKPAGKDFSFEEVFRGHGANHQSTFVKTEILKRDRYDTRFKFQADDFFFLDHTVFKGCSYEPVNVVVANYDMTGVSNDRKNLKALAKERELFLNEHLPPRILQDYRTSIVRKNINSAFTFCRKAKRYSLRHLKILLHIE